MNKQMEIFSFSPPIKLVGEDKWLLGVSSFQATSFVFNITDENNSFSVSTTSHWNFKDAAELVNKLDKLYVDLKTISNYMLKKLQK